LEDIENGILQIKDTIENGNKEIQKKTRMTTSKENEIEQLRNKRQETYRKCQVEEIELPSSSQKEEPKKKKRQNLKEMMMKKNLFYQVKNFQFHKKKNLKQEVEKNLKKFQLISLH